MKTSVIDLAAAVFVFATSAAVQGHAFGSELPIDDSTKRFGVVPNGNAVLLDGLTIEQLARESAMNVGSPGLARRTNVKEKAGSASIFGSIRDNGGNDVCGLVLANGQFMFSCSPNGQYSLTAPLDSNNQLTVFGFADGHFPYRATVGSAGGRWDITLNIASTGGGGGGGGTSKSTVSFIMTDSCHDGYAIDYKFFDEDNNLVWPSATQVYYTNFDDTPYRSDLSCITGARICYGARNENPFNKGYWGVDIDNSKSCSNCCISCQDGNVVRYSMSC